MKINDEIQVKVEKFADSGIARYDGLVIFIRDACPEDVVKIQITKVNKNWAEAKIVDIIRPSRYRAAPFCPMHKVCGSCQLQYITYPYQLRIKKNIVEDAIYKIGEIETEIRDVIPSPEIRAYRHKVQYPISQTKVSKRILAGYYKLKTHEVVNIKYCPIQPLICDKIIEFIRVIATEFNILGYDEKNHIGDLRHVILRVSRYTGQVLVTLVVNSTKISERIKGFAKNIYEKFDKVSGVCVNFNSKKTNVIMGEKSECAIGDAFLKEKILDKEFKIGSTSFFQVNPYTAENIFKFVREYIKNNFDSPVVLDAYAGISAFGVIVSDVAKKVVSVEENPEAVSLAKETMFLNRIDNIEVHNKDTQNYLEKENTKFDVTIIDPPRKGCTQEVLDGILRLTEKKIIYVSCNPSTLARDLKYLVEKGAKVEFVQPFDMFCHTKHVECVSVINLR